MYLNNRVAYRTRHANLYGRIRTEVPVFSPLIDPIQDQAERWRERDRVRGLAPVLDPIQD